MLFNLPSWSRRPALRESGRSESSSFCNSHLVSFYIYIFLEAKFHVFCSWDSVQNYVCDYSVSYDHTHDSPSEKWNSFYVVNDSTSYSMYCCIHWSQWNHFSICGGEGKIPSSGVFLDWFRQVSLSFAADSHCGCIFHTAGSSFCIASNGISPSTHIFGKSLTS